MLKKLVVLLVALFAIGGSVSAYAWWDTLQQTQNETLTVGEGTTLTVDVVATAPVGKVLVPSGTIFLMNAASLVNSKDHLCSWPKPVVFPSHQMLFLPNPKVSGT